MFVSKAAYQRAVDEVVYLRARVGHLEERLELERHENRMAERHWSNALLRAKQAFPQSEKVAVPVPKAPPTLDQLVDPGEREALRTEAARLGIDPALADEILRKERGLALG